MLSWKVILQTLLVIIGTILIFIFFVPRIMEGIALTHPIFYEMEEEFRCHLFQPHGLCLSMYPNRVRIGDEVKVTIRTRRWYDGEIACLWKEGKDNAIVCCTITKGKCRSSFKVSDVSFCGGYFAFLDTIQDQKWEEGEMKGEEKELECYIPVV